VRLNGSPVVERKLISWNDHKPKYNIYDWSADGDKIGKGVLLYKEEVLNSLEL
jgi:hypothetical protein